MTDPMPLEDRRRLLSGVIRIMAQADARTQTVPAPPISRLTSIFRRLLGGH